MIRLTEPQISEKEVEAVSDVLRSGQLVQGKWVDSFEEALGRFMGAEHVVACSSGTAALHLSLLAIGVGRGDAVFVPAYTFPATANVIEIAGARPILMDVDPETYCLTPDTLVEALDAWTGSEQPKAVIVVHEFGAPCDMGKIMELSEAEGLNVIEDAACSLGSRFGEKHVGTFGLTGCFSWHPRKAITTGEGGAVVTSNIEISQRLKMLRNHGIERGPDGTIDFPVPGLNYRLTDFQAALGLTQLHQFPDCLTARADLVAVYRRSLEEVPGIRVPKMVDGHAWQTFMVVLPTGENRNRVIAELRQRGIESNLGAQGLHMIKYYRKRYAYKKEDYPVATELYERGLALPLYPNLTANQIVKIADALKEILNR